MIPKISVPGRKCVSDQWERILRRYQTLKEIDEARACPASLEEQNDAVLPFFQDCYHFKDWIKNSCGNESLIIEIEKFVSESPSLTICGEICNGTKHLDTSRSRGYKKYGEISLPRAYVLIDTNEENPHVKSVKFSVTSAKTKEVFDTFDLATECLKEWRNFLVKQGLS